jgi:hypothetical protein
MAKKKSEPTLEERAILVGLPADATIEAIEEAESNVNTPSEPDKFVNPFQKGVTYADFVKALGDKTVAEYAGAYLTIQEVSWLEREIEHYKNK